MKTTDFSKLICLILCLSTVVGLFACSEKETVDTESYYLYEYDDDFINNADMAYLEYSISNGKILYPKREEITYVMDDYQMVGSTIDKYEIADLLTGETKSVECFPSAFYELNNYQKANSTVRAFSLMSGGEILLLWGSPKIKSPDEQEVTDNGVYSIITFELNYYLSLFKDEQEIWTLPLEETEIGYISNSAIEVLTTDSGDIFIFFSDNAELFKISSSGKNITKIELPEEIGINSTINLYKNQDGNLCISDYEIKRDGVTYYLYSMDENNEFNDLLKVTCPYNGAIPEFIIGKGHDEYLKMSGAVWYVDNSAEECEPEVLFELFNVGLSSSMVSELYPIDEDTWFVIYKDEIDNLSHSGIIKKTLFSEYLEYYAAKNGVESVENINDKQVLTIVTAENLSIDSIYNVSGRLMNYMQRFNRSNMQYQLKLERVSGDESEVTGNLMRKMLSGDMPDIIAFAEGMRSRNFSNQDMFSDFYSFMKKDSEYSKDSFLPCVLETFENSDGELQLLTTDFSIDTMIAFHENTDGVLNLTVEEMIDYANSLPKDKYFVSAIARETFFESLLSVTVGDFIDYEDKKCDFENATFKSLMEFCKNVSVKQSTVFDIDSVIKCQTYDKLGNYLLFTKAQYLGKEIVPVGYPSDDSSNGAALSPLMQFAIPKDAENKNGAWSFIKTYLDCQSDEYETMYNGISCGDRTALNKITNIPGFPCTENAAENLLNILGDVHTLIVYTEGKNGSYSSSGSIYWNYKKEYNNTKKEYEYVLDESYKDTQFLNKYALSQGYSNGTVRATYGEFTDDEIQFFKNIFSSKCRIVSDDTETLNIITEEASAYFAGERSIEDTVKLIQDRVTTRISE